MKLNNDKEPLKYTFTSIYTRISQGQLRLLNEFFGKFHKQTGLSTQKHVKATLRAVVLNFNK